MNTLRPRFCPFLSSCHPAKRRRAALAALLCMGSLAALGLAQSSFAESPMPRAPAAQTAISAAPLNSALDAQLLYELLLGELHVQRGDIGNGYSIVLNAARKRQDAQLYQRAVQMAWQAKSGGSALAAARAWAQDLPHSAQAHRLVLQLLLDLDRAAEVGPALRAVLAHSASVDERRAAIFSIVPSLARLSNNDLAQAAVQEGLKDVERLAPYAASLQAALGRMALARGRSPEALDLAHQAQQADPHAPFAALLALELLEQGPSSPAETLVQQYLQSQPKTQAHTPPVGLLYARVLLQQQRPSEARSQLIALTAQEPAQADAWLLLGALQRQEQQWSEASTSLQTYIGLVRAAKDAPAPHTLTPAYLQMADIAEKQGQLDAAAAWLDRIEPDPTPEQAVAVQLRRASLLAQKGQMPSARALLRHHAQDQPSQARLALMAEVQLLREFNEWQQAYALYAQEGERFAQDTEILYDWALVAERAARHDTMERLLRQIISRQPTDAQAYNALGYSLADRNERLELAEQLIAKALELAPHDAHIQDSQGWLQYRLGRLERALELLQKAYQKSPDADIAAHLGEVLWVMGQRQQAQAIWQQALKRAPDNATLQSTLKRLGASRP